MKLQMKLQSSLITIGLVFVMLLGMAFQCGNDNPSDGKTSSVGAPTQEEVKQAIEKFHHELVSYKGSVAKVVSWDSQIQILPGRKDYINTDSGGDNMMYPVKVDYTVTVDDTYTTRYKGGALGFHKNAFGEWKYYTLEDYQSN